MQTLLLIIFIIVLVSTVLLTILFRKNTGAKIIIILSMFAVNIPIFFIMYQAHENEIQNEIKRVIKEYKSGEVVSILKISYEDVELTPFSTANKTNNLYEIQYKIKDTEYTAWYRAKNVVNNRHDQDPIYGEKWIFDRVPWQRSFD